MVLSETTNNTGLVEDARWWTDTSTTSFPTVDVNRSINKWYQASVSDALLSMDSWNFAGEIATASTVANQQEYSFPTDMLKISRAEITYDGTNWYRITPFDVHSADESVANQTNVNNAFSTSDPYYDSHDNSLFLFPVPTSAVTNGLKIWYEKDISELSSATDTPNLPDHFHRILSMGAAYDFFLKKGMMSEADRLNVQIQALRKDLKKFYNTRSTDQQYVFKGKKMNYN